MAKINYKTIDKQLKAIEEKLLGRIEELATQIILKNESITGFCMAMGSATFGVEYKEIFDPEDLTDFLTRDEDIDPYDLLRLEHIDLKARAQLEEMDRILENYNDMYRLTGEPIKIDKVNGEIITKSDWLTKPNN